METLPHGDPLTHSEYWTRRKPIGPPKRYETAEALWADCVEYFEWVQANPLLEEKAASNEGVPTTIHLRKMRAMTIGSLCAFIGIGRRTWHQWADGDRKREDLAEVIDRVDTIMKAQKFEGAAAGLLNPVIIARDLGLSDRQEVTGADGAPLVPAQSPDDIARRLAFMLTAPKEDET